MRGTTNERGTVLRVTILIAASGLPAAWPAAILAQSDPLQEAFPTAIRVDELRGSVGFEIQGAVARESSGSSVRPAGDVNNDGVDDVIINTAGTRAAYVLFGRPGGLDPVVSLADLDGENGFVLRLDAPGDRFIFALGAGDLNGDGIDDIIVGDPEASPGGLTAAGQAFIVFGRSGPFPAEVDVLSLDGSDGFAIVGEAADDRAGNAIAAAGDFNGDGIDDVAMTGFGSRCCGAISKAFVIFGSRTGFGATLELSTLDGTNGFRVVGPDAGERLRDVAGAGDVNGDGLDDLVFSNSQADPRGRSIAGSAFVLFGADGGFGPEFDLTELDGQNGFRVDGAESGDTVGTGIGTAGDVNGDGFNDVVIGASGAGPFYQGFNAGRTYVVFGKDAAFEPAIDLAGFGNPDGFRIDGASSEASSGWDVGSAGDINGDGFDDTLVGAPTTGWEIISYYPFESRSGSGEAYVVFGRGDGFPDVVAARDLDVDEGFRVVGVSESYCGSSVSFAGDVNGDGNDDFIIGEYVANPRGMVNAGASYVIYGRDLFPCPADLDDDGRLTLFDFLTFGNLFDAGDPRADFDGDGDLTLFDFLAFQNAFDAGCP